MPKPSHPSARLFAAVLAAEHSPAAPARLWQLKQAIRYHARAVAQLTSQGAHGSLEPVSTR